MRSNAAIGAVDVVDAERSISRRGDSDFDGFPDGVRLGPSEPVDPGARVIAGPLAVGVFSGRGM